MGVKSNPDGGPEGIRLHKTNNNDGSSNSNSNSSSSLSSGSHGDEDTGNTRESWSNKSEYLLSVVGYCVGLGNIWRFPYICMKNGGGAFLIPFLLALFVCGLPCFYLESILGQFLGKSAYHVWSICPLIRGIGFSINIAAGFCVIYYPIILAWSLVYLVNCFKSPLPWTLCGQEWNTPDCFTSSERKYILGGANASLVTAAAAGNESLSVDELLSNASLRLARNSSVTTSSNEEFWWHNVLEISTGLWDIGGFSWPVVLALLITNVTVLVGIIKGIRSSGKVVYVTATLPYFLLIVLMILGFTLPGAADGVIFYIKPDFSKLMSYQPWTEAAIQVFYSLGPGWGGIITMASYNKFHNNCQRDSLLLTICCEGTSLFGGFVVFMILGHMALKSGVHISKFAASGPGLAFIVYPEAISYLPLPQLWGFLFFLMLFTLGLDSMFVYAETILTTLNDAFPAFMRKWRIHVTTATISMSTILTLIYTTNAGMYWFQLTDWYVAAFSILLHCAIECLAVGWFYGSERFAKDIELMIGSRPSVIYVWAWKVVTPLALIMLWVITLAFYSPPFYNSYIFPREAEVIGWLIAASPFTLVIYHMFKELYKHPGSIKERFRKACEPTPEWQPAPSDVREKYAKMLDTDSYELPCLKV